MNKIAPFSADGYFDALLNEFEGGVRPQLAHFSRRSILKFAGASAGGLVLAVTFGPIGEAEAAAAAKEFAPNAFLRVSPDNSIFIYSQRPEIGQGIKTAMPLIVAEELDAAWSDVRVGQAPINPKLYGRQSAGGSTSIPTSWDRLRMAGATARTMLKSAAAQQWNVPEAELITADSKVFHAKTKREATYGSLAIKAASLPVPEESKLVLKTRDQYRLLGKSYTGVDNPKVVVGEPLFGIDQVVPGMLYAAFEKCPAVGGKVVKANLDYIKALPGVRDAFIVEGSGQVAEVMPGVAILADSTWEAFQAKSALQIEWDESKASKDSWSQLSNQAKVLAGQAGAESVIKSGDPDAALAGAAKTVTAFYSYPFLPHSPLEPQNTTAWFKGDSVELWAPTQTPEAAIAAVAKLLNLPEEKVTLNQTRAGGGFGRRLINDPVCEAAVISKQAGGRPIKLTWTREDDMRHDFYRPGGFSQMTAGLDAQGKLIAWRQHFITFTSDGKTPVAAGNIPASEFPMGLVANGEITQSMLSLMTPTGPWRAPRSNALAFVGQSFTHELAVAAGRDPVEFLLEILGEPRHLEPRTSGALNTGRAAAVIKMAAEKAGWGKPMPKGRGIGIAFYFCHQGHFAEVADVSVDNNKRVTVNRMVVVGDIGPIVNMSGATHQCEGAVVDAVSTMMNLEVGIENGRILQSNFAEYPILRINKSPPQIEVHFIQSDFAPTGVGEPAFPPAIAAIANAIYAASGIRVRSMPLRKEGLSI